jgi:hypothetical protein
MTGRARLHPGGRRDGSGRPVGKSKPKWSEDEEGDDFDAAFKYFSLLCSNSKPGLSRAFEARN